MVRCSEQIWPDSSENRKDIDGTDQKHVSVLHVYRFYTGERSGEVGSSGPAN